MKQICLRCNVKCDNIPLAGVCAGAIGLTAPGGEPTITFVKDGATVVATLDFGLTVIVVCGNFTCAIFPVNDI